MGAITYVSDLTPKSASNGSGPVERDRSNGGSKAGDGRTIRLNGVSFSKGLGVHATSDVRYALGSGAARFLADVGVDDECGASGSVRFEVFVDGVKVFSGSKVTGSSATVAVNVKVSGKKELRLLVTNGGDGNACDHADWAGARITGSGAPAPTTTTTTSTTTTTTALPTAPRAFRFEDVTSATGLDALANAYSHAAAWGDVNGDSKPDLFVGTFAGARPDGAPPSPNRLLFQSASTFQGAGQAAVEGSGRASGAVFADLDNDGDLDLAVSNNRVVHTGANAVELEPHHLYRNDGGTLSDVSASSGIRAADRNGRAIGVLDYDRDGRLDLFVVADSLTGTGARVSKLLRNTGALTFQDVTASAGLPTNLAGLGVAVGDANGDGWPDIVMTGGVSGSGSYANAYLFVNNRNATFFDATTPNLSWTTRGTEDWTAGAAWGDLNRDGRLDLVVAHHFDSAASTPLAPRVYLNGGNDGTGKPILEELTGAGLAPIASKAPHVEIQDFDNDGWADIYVSVRLDTSSGPVPFIYKNNGATNGRPTFTSPASPQITYYSPGGPTADYDGDGRLDVFLEGFATDVPPSLLRNTTAPAGNWLRVKVSAGGNTMGLGAKVKVYRAGGLGQPGALLGMYEISTGNGYSSAQSPIAHFGLGQATAVDVEVTMPFGGPAVTSSNVHANQTIAIAA